MGKKNKTKKAVLKRVRITGKGKVKYGRPGKSHLQSGKSGNRRRRLRQPQVLKKSEEKRFLALVR